MKEIITFAQTATPLMVIGVLSLAVVFLAKNLGVGDILKKLRGTQMDDKSTVSSKVATDAIDYAIIIGKLDKIADNHLHELPEIKKSVDRIEITMNEMKDNFGNRLTRVETRVDSLMK